MGKIFVVVDPDQLQAMLPAGCVLRPWHVVLHERDEAALYAAIAHLPEPARRLKYAVGRKILQSEENLSVQADADDEFMLPDIEVVNGFVHFSQPGDARSTR